ncbi:S8 family serine peptidase [Luminiphilus sp.]|nr:S8 family serine peptidase [Luminiphilus sp.]MDB3923454.1 S8 family serine peptidase [Luminiphilus sp.]
MPILSEGTQRNNSTGLDFALLLLLLLTLSFSASSVHADFTFGGGEGAEEAAEEEVEEQVEEQIEESVTEETTEATEDEVADSVEEQVIDDAEEAVEDELTFGGVNNPAEDEVEEQVEEQVEDQLEEQVAEETEDSVEENVAEEAEQSVEEDVAEQAEEVVEEQVAEQSEEAVEEEVEEATEQQVVDITEETVEEEVEADIEESVVAEAESSVSESVEDEVGDVVEDVVEETVADSTEGELEEQVAEAVEQSASESAEEQVAESVDQVVEESAEEEVAESVDQVVEESAEEQVAESVDQVVEESAEEQVAESVDQVVEESAEEQVAESVDQVVEESAEEQVAEGVEQSAETSVEEEVADAATSEVEADVADTTEGDVGELIAQQAESEAIISAEAVAIQGAEGRLAAEVDEVIDAIEVEIDVDARRIHQGQWLVMAEPKVFDELASEGYIFDEFTELPGLGLRLAEVAAPASFDISKTRDGIMDVVGDDRAEVDLNHIYTAGIPEPQSYEAGISPTDAMPFPLSLATMNLRIGIVDSAVDTDHPAFATAKISSRPFADAEQLPNYHGTAIASIIAANAAPLRGLAPESELFAAAVFEQDETRGEIASTVSLVRALDWLLSSQVDAINLSLAGPPNRLLEVALKRISEQGVMVLAAAGNGGPMARPQYPAAYASVVAVTAVDQRGRAFRLANRGDYLDLAAPGVNLRHAVAGGGYAASSGTSFAVPFAVTAAALMKHQEPDSDVIARLYAAATDIGPPGRDDIYGYGLLTL